jgi:helicase MOV-10
VQAQNAQSGYWFEGRVHFVRQKEVGLVFHRSFSGWTSTKLYNVRFKLNRYPIRREHLAMESPFSEERVLFPRLVHFPRTPPAAGRLRLFNSLIATNVPQLHAVWSISRMNPGAAPFIIFGP